MALLPLTLLACKGEKKEPVTVVTIDSVPEQGASVNIGGTIRGVTPLTIYGLEPGWNNILLKLENYHTTPDRIEVKEDQPKTFVIELKPLVGFLSIESSPQRATIMLDGEINLGQTPLVGATIPIGDHAYELTLENHYPVSKEFTVEQDYAYDYNHRIEPVEARLRVYSVPSGANIWLNALIQTKTTPASFELPPGTYSVDVHTEGYIQKGTRIALTPNDDGEVLIELLAGQAPQGMVLVPSGAFIFGEENRAPDEEPRRKLSLDAYYIDKYEVTNADFKTVFAGHEITEGENDFPAQGISWGQATAYAKTIGKRLPTEAEWEKAARGTDGREFPWGETFDATISNYKGAGLRQTARVGKFHGNTSPYGCVDMGGNVFEWTSDWYKPYPGNDRVKEDYGQRFRVLRGGSFMSDEFGLRCAGRHFDTTDSTRIDYGFRCVMDIRN